MRPSEHEGIRSIVIQTMKGTGAEGREAVRMYSNNNLKQVDGVIRNLAFEIVCENFKGVKRS